MNAEYSGDLAASAAGPHQQDAGALRDLAAPQLAILGAEAWSSEPAYTVVSAVRVDGVPRWDRLAEAARATLIRHDVLTWQPAIGADGTLRVAADRAGAAVCTIEQINLAGLARADTDTAIHERLHRERHRAIRVMNPEARPHTLMLLFRTHDAPSGESGVCALVTHHLFVDEYSTDLIWNEVFRRAAAKDTDDAYDLRYAAWARSTVTPSARQAARRAAGDLVAHLHGTALEVTASAPGARTAPGSPVRFTIPATLTDAAAARARAAQVPVAAVYAAAFGQLLCARADTGGLAVAVPVTRRTDVADIATVGCYVSTLPVPVRAERDPSTAIRQWHRALTDTAALAHADTTTLRSRLGGTAQVSLSFEARGGRRSAKPITWTPLAPPDSPAKSTLACFLSPGTSNSTGDGRLLWRTGALNQNAAGELVEDFLAKLARFTAPGLPLQAPERR